MEKMKWIKKGISALLALNMVLSSVPLSVFAVTEDNLCDHHTAHTADCGYAEAVAGVACGHEHSEDCYAILACLHTCGDECENPCTHECTVENGCITMELDCHHSHDGSCGYSEGTAEVPCGHQHDGSCGYVEAVAEVLCACAETDESGALIHTEGCGYVAAVEGQPCGHTEHLDCGYAPATEGTPCTHTHAVKVDSADSCYKLLCSHKDGGHDDACGYVAAVEAHECHYECAECVAALTADETTEPSTEATEPSTEPAPVCNCGTDDPAIHATTCAVYVAPETAVCYCTEKCSDTNVWCDVCGFDYTQCGGTDTATVYADDWFTVSGNTVTIDGTLGGKTTATEDDITALVDAIKGYVDSGITTITVTGSEPALYNFYDAYTPAVSVAIFRLTEDSESSNGSGDPDSPYCGKIDLILQDVTEIVEMEFNNSFALNSITLPKVTKLGAQAFALCNYLQTITFGSVVTEGIENGEQVFNSVGSKVDGGLCHLVLSCGQVNAATEYQPNIETKKWWKTPWKHITLAHTNSYQDLGNGTHSAVCTVCGATGTEDHSGGEATCITPAECKKCGSEYGTVDANAHSFDETTGICTLCGAVRITGYAPNSDGGASVKNADSGSTTGWTDPYGGSDLQFNWGADSPVYTELWDGSGKLHSETVTAQPDETNDNYMQFTIAGSYEGTPTNVLATYGIDDDLTATMPNEFTQSDDLDPSFLNEYVLLQGSGAYGEQVNFTHIPAIFRLKIKNARGVPTMIYSVSIRLVDEAGEICPIASSGVTLTASADGWTTTFSGEYTEITTNIDAMLDAGAYYHAYAAALPLSGTDPLKGKTIQVVLNLDDPTYTAEEGEFESVVYELDAEIVAGINGGSYNWVGGNSYTFEIMTDQNCINSVSVTPFVEKELESVCAVKDSTDTSDFAAVAAASASVTVGDYYLYNCSIGVTTTNELNTGEAYNMPNIEWVNESTDYPYYEYFTNFNGQAWVYGSTLTAYAPYSKDYTSITYNLAADNYLFYGKSGTVTAEYSELTLDHKLAKLVVKVSGLPTGTTVQNVELSGIYTAATFDGSTGTLTPTGDKGAIGLFVLDPYGDTLLIPMTEEEVTLRIQLSDNSVYTATMKLAPEAGTQYNLTVNLEHTGTLSYEDNGDGTHTATWSCCGETFTEDHSGEDDGDCTTAVTCTICGTTITEAQTHSYTNGFCTNTLSDGTVCDDYQPCEGSGTEADPYKIGNAGQLYWFAEQVNGGKNTINAVLTEDIKVYEGTVSYNTTDARPWTPIGNDTTQYTGTFDGDGHTISGLFANYNGSGNYVGLIGYLGAGGTVKRLSVTNSILTGGNKNYGLIAGYNAGTIENCSTAGSVSGTMRMSGLVGWNANTGRIVNCYTTASVSGGTNLGYLAGVNDGTVMNSYCSGPTSEYVHTGPFGYQNGTVDDQSGIMTADQFASGEVAYLLQGEQTEHIWGQTIGTDSYPTLGGAKVYAGYDTCANDAAVVYTNTETPAEKVHTYVNGICTAVVGEIHYEPAKQNESGIYEIGNAGQLMWFAELVNGGEKTANAILIDNIDMTGIDWTPICSTGLYYGSSYASGYGDADTGYAGIFDGNYHVIKNLSVTAIANETWTYGLFGTMTGTVKNLGIEGFTYNHNGATDMRTGAIVGQNLGGTIENCYVVKATITPGTNVAGGITGCNYEGTIKNCYVADSNIVANSARYGYIAGDNRADTAGDRVGTIENCYTDGGLLVGSYTGTETNSKYGVNYNYFTNGGVVWYLNGQSADGIWKQGETHPNFTGTAVTQSLLSSYTEPAKVDGVYQIKTESELRWFAEYVNFTDASVSAVLANNIAMTGDNWIPIGNSANPYTGTFDGQGYGITGFAMSITEGGRYGLFGEISGATVKNFSISGEVTANLPSQQTFYYGVIGASANSTITDVHSSVNLKVKDSFDKNGIAGIVASITTTTIERCSFSGTLDIGTAYIDCAGGIVGYAGWNNTHVIRDCAFYGKIIAKNASSAKTSSGQIGGILGYYRGSNITIESCLSVGTFDVANTTFTGMIGGRVLQMGADNISKVSNNYYYGNLPAFSDTEDSTHGYWNADMADYEGYGDTNAKSVTDTQLKSGEVTWLLNGSTTENAVWYQTIGLHDYPVFEGATVNLNGTTYENTGNYIYVEISWTGMEFTYISGDWNPETHQYDEGYWKGDVVNNGEVTVTNKGSAVYVSYGYTSLVDGVSGSFTCDSLCLENGESYVNYLALEGRPTGGSFEDQPIGTITVTISQTPPASFTRWWEVGDTVDHIGKNGKVYSCYIADERDGKYVLLTKEPEIFTTTDAEQLEALKETQLEAVGATRYPAFDSSKAEYAKYESYALESLSASNNYEQYISLAVNSAGEYVWLWKDGTYLVVIEQDISTYYENYDIKACFYYIFEVPAS